MPEIETNVFHCYVRRHKNNNSLRINQEKNVRFIHERNRSKQKSQRRKRGNAKSVLK